VSAADLTDRVIHTPAGTGPATWAMGSLFERLAGGAGTGGGLSAAVVTQPPASRPRCTCTPARRRRGSSSTAP
jgi:hypothetical protein